MPIFSGCAGVFGVSGVAGVSTTAGTSTRTLPVSELVPLTMAFAAPAIAVLLRHNPSNG
ncbi:hypothetical protein [Hydrogenoanaerobacterium sp.]|uniref:hypothetical protein n=1 Tax=Hydrogenoanaerobacterium sp. TaxID=2953763 RepID=UPI00289EDF9D|nr:hypothetical protein [Hydrogenoanaerobacterium sp.]